MQKPCTYFFSLLYVLLKLTEMTHEWQICFIVEKDDDGSYDESSADSENEDKDKDSDSSESNNGKKTDKKETDDTWRRKNSHSFSFAKKEW